MFAGSGELSDRERADDWRKAAVVDAGVDMIEHLLSENGHLAAAKGH